MPYRIGGYYMSFATVYRVMKALEIPNPWNYDDITLEFGINYWLCDHNKKDVLAAYIDWEGEAGMMLVSSFKYIPYGMPDCGDLEESKRDKTIAKEWLMKGTGVEAEELKWISLIDDRKITLNGIYPTKTIIEKSNKTGAEVIAELEEEVRIRELELSKRNKQ